MRGRHEALDAMIAAAAAPPAMVVMPRATAVVSHRVLVVGVCVAAALWRLLTFGGFSNDHYVHVARGYQMLLGAWPVRDFVDPGMPLTYVISALGRVLFGNRLRSEFIVMALGFAVGAGATAWAALRLAPSLAIALAVSTLEILSSPRTYSYPKMLVYGVAGCMVVALAADASRRRVGLAGILTAVAFLVRHDHGLYVGASCAAAILLGAGSLPAAVRRLARFLAVSAACLTPWAVAVQVNGGLVPYFRAGLEFSRREADVSLLRTWPSFDLTSPVLSAANAGAWLFYLAYALPVVCAALAWRRHARGTTAWPGESAAVGALALLALAVARGFVRDPLAARLPDVMVPLCLLGAWALGAACLGPWRPWRVAAPGGGARLVAAAVLVITSAAVWRIGDVHTRMDDAGLLDGWDALVSNTRDTWSELSHRQRDVERTPTRVSAALVPFFGYVERCTTRADRLLVTGAYADVFIAADRGFAGGQVSYQQGFASSEADQRQTLARLQRESVPFVVRIGTSDAIFRGNFPLVAAWVDRTYEPLTEVESVQEEGIKILVDRRRAPIGSDLDTGWPCFR